MHPHLVKALTRVVSFNKEKETIYFKQGVQKIIADHLAWVSGWLNSNNEILEKLTKLTDKATASSRKDDIELCQMAIEEWENADRAVGMRYMALSKRYRKLMTVEKKQILKDAIDAHEAEITKLITKANLLAETWQKKLGGYAYHAQVATALTWLAALTLTELKENYERWETEKL